MRARCPLRSLFRRAAAAAAASLSLRSVVTANNPRAPHNLVIFNFLEREFKPVAAASDEHISFHVSRNGTLLHLQSEDASDQKAYERNFKDERDTRRRARVKEAQEQNPPKQLSAEEMEDDVQRNQFNFTERAVQSFDNTTKTRVVSTTPPESVSVRGSMTQWALYDAYVIEYDRMIYVSWAHGTQGASLARARASSCAHADAQTRCVWRTRSRK